MAEEATVGSNAEAAVEAKVSDLDDDLKERRDEIAVMIAAFEEEIASLQEAARTRRAQVNELREKVARYNMALGLTRAGEVRKRRQPATPE